ncbi:DUF3310 domain-containing protein [Oxalobacter formigenes]|nr:DUF3310 domain-containing protein [Oxalobacter formigenes]
MGLTSRQHPLPFLKHLISKGSVNFRDKVWTLCDIATTNPNTADEALNKTALEESKIGITEQSFDPVNQPSHYKTGGIEMIDILQAKLSPEEFKGFLKGNVLKYTIRAEHKNGIEDYEKASVYANWLVQAAKGEAQNGI